MIRSWMFKKGSPFGELCYVMFTKHNPTICLSFPGCLGEEAEVSDPAC